MLENVDRRRFLLFIPLALIIVGSLFIVNTQTPTQTPTQSDDSDIFHAHYTQEFNLSSQVSMSLSYGGLVRQEWINATISFSTQPSYKIFFVLMTPSTSLDTGWIINSTGIYEILPDYGPYLFQEANASFTVGHEYFSLYSTDIDGWVGSNTQGVHCYFKYLTRPTQGHVILTLTIDGYQEVG